MTGTFPTDLNQFIQDELQTSGYADEDALLTAALEVFREVRQRHAELRGRVQESLARDCNSCNSNSGPSVCLQGLQLGAAPRGHPPVYGRLGNL